MRKTRHEDIMMLTMNMMNCAMVDRQKTFCFISIRDDCQRCSPSQISNMLRVGFERAQHLSSGFDK